MKRIIRILIVIIVIMVINVITSRKMEVFAACPAGQHEETQSVCDGCWTDQICDVNCHSEYQGNNCPDGPGCILVNKCDCRGGTWHQCCGTYSQQTVCIPNPTSLPTLIPTNSPIVPTPTITISSNIPSVTISTHSGCPLKSQGDADCDGKIDINDFKIWRSEFDTLVPPNPINNNANFICSENDPLSRFVDLIDFEIWRRNFYK